MAEKKDEKKCTNAEYIEHELSRGKGSTWCKLKRKDKDYEIGCVACPYEFATVGHCTGNAYSTTFFGEGEFQEEIAQECPGLNNPDIDLAEVEDFNVKIKKEFNDWLKEEYAKKGIERLIL